MNKKDKSWPRLTSHTAPSLTFFKNKTKQNNVNILWSMENLASYGLFYFLEKLNNI